MDFETNRVRPTSTIIDRAILTSSPLHLFFFLFPLFFPTTARARRDGGATTSPLQASSQLARPRLGLGYVRRLSLLETWVDARKGSKSGRRFFLLPLPSHFLRRVLLFCVLSHRNSPNLAFFRFVFVERFEERERFLVSGFFFNARSSGASVGAEPSVSLMPRSPESHESK
jgi:hypothetical protein